MHFNIWTVEISVAFKIIVFFFLLYMYVANSQINLFLNLYFIYLYDILISFIILILKADESGE